MTNQISVNPKLFTRLLIIILAVLFLANCSVKLLVYFSGHKSIYGLVQLFDFDQEANIPTWFSTILLIIAGFNLSIIYLMERKRKSGQILQWAILAVGFIYMSLDEASSVHEQLTPIVMKLTGVANRGIFFFSWVIIGSLIVLMLIPFFLKFLFRLPARIRYAFLISGVIYVSGALGMELLGGRYAELHGQENLVYYTFTTIEETLEMAGLIIFISALMRYIYDNFKEVRFMFGESNG